MPWHLMFDQWLNVEKCFSTTAGPATTPAHRRVPHSAVKSGHKSAARRRGHLSMPGGSLGTPGGRSPFLREGSPMDWSPSVPTSAASAPAGTIRSVYKRNGDEHTLVISTVFRVHAISSYNMPLDTGTSTIEYTVLGAQKARL